MDLPEALAALPRGHGPKAPAGALTVKQVAEGAGVGVDMVKNWIHEGRFPNAWRAGPGKTHPWFIPEADIIAAAGQGPGRVDPTRWLIQIGCNGLTCGGCGEVLIHKRKGEPLGTALHMLTACVTEHLTTCKRAQEP